MPILNRFNRGSSGRTRRLDTEDARQADDRRDTVRVLDASLVLAAAAFVLLGVYVAVSLAS